MDYLIIDIETAGIPNAADFLPLEDIQADGRLKDPVKIADDIAAKQRALVESAALDLDLARVVTIGFTDNVCTSAAFVTTCQSEGDERKALSGLAAVIETRPTIVTFNGHKYDLPLLMRRARYLGVTFPAINLDRYKSPHIDLYDVLTLKGAVKAHGDRKSVV